MRLIPMSPASSVTTSEMRPSLVSATRVAAAKATATRATPAVSESQRTLVGGSENAGAKPAHSLEPAIVVGRLAAKVLGDLGVGKDEELLVRDALQNDLGHFI